MIERTLVLIKPDGVKRSLVGRILSKFEDAGLKIVGMKLVWVDTKLAAQHYKAHTKKPFYKDLVGYFTTGPIVAAVIEGVHAVQNVRKLVGDTSPHEAAPGTIRGDFSHTSMAYSSKTGSGGKNIIHASATLKEAKQEIKLWFAKGELHSYTTVHQEHTF